MCRVGWPHQVYNPYGSTDPIRFSNPTGQMARYTPCSPIWRVGGPHKVCKPYGSNVHVHYSVHKANKANIEHV